MYAFISRKSTTLKGTFALEAKSIARKNFATPLFTFYDTKIPRQHSAIKEKGERFVTKVLFRG